MALKETYVVIDKGRDATKTFYIKEWPCIKTEKWILRAVFGLGKVGVEIPPEIIAMGAVPVAYALASQVLKLPSRLGIKLADELMECVQRVEKTANRPLVDQDIEDFSTRLLLKMEVLKLHFGFFELGAFQNSGLSASDPASKPEQ